jgi:hypothetical protein
MAPVVHSNTASAYPPVETASVSKKQMMPHSRATVGNLRTHPKALKGLKYVADLGFYR